MFKAFCRLTNPMPRFSKISRDLMTLSDEKIPVSYTHLDVYKRQDRLISAMIDAALSLPDLPLAFVIAAYLSSGTGSLLLCICVPFPVAWTVKMKKKQKETQDIFSYHTCLLYTSRCV